MPWPTVVLLSVSAFLKSWGLLTLGLCLFVCACGSSMDPGGRLTGFGWIAPRCECGTRTIIQSLAIARFCRVLGTLLQNGVPMLKSLEIARQATGIEC